MKRILLRYYPKNNFGDDLFVHVIANRYKNQFSLASKYNSAFLRNTNNIKNYGHMFSCLIIRAIEIAFRKNNIWLRILQKKTNLLVYIGGSVFIDDNNAAKWADEKNFYQKLSIPYYILGSNFGPYKSTAFVDTVGEIFAGARDVCFRDQASYEVFKNVETTRVASDIVFTLDTSPYTHEQEKLAVFSIINCQNRFSKKLSDKYDHEIARMTKSLVASGYKIAYMSFCKYEGDEIAIQRITNALDAKTAAKVNTFKYDGDIDAALSLIARSEIVVAARFHAVILGLLFGKKVIPMAYSKKTTNILNDMKFKGNIIDINRIDKFDGSKFDFSSLQVNDVSRQIKLAELQFQELDKVLVRKK